MNKAGVSENIRDGVCDWSGRSGKAKESVVQNEMERHLAQGRDVHYERKDVLG